MDTSYYLPKYLDSPFRLVILTLDECVVFGCPFALGFLFNFVIIGFCFSIASLFFWRWVKGDAKGYRYAAALSYWYMSKSHLRAFPNSHCREYLG